jgi:hypothetical protein
MVRSGWLHPEHHDVTAAGEPKSPGEQGGSDTRLDGVVQGVGESSN